VRQADLALLRMGSTGRNSPGVTKQFLDGRIPFRPLGMAPQNQPFGHIGPSIVIGNGCWLAAGATILSGMVASLLDVGQLVERLLACRALLYAKM
jgi:hypothetical protein